MRRNWLHTRRACDSLRGLPAEVKQALELLPATTHPMDVLRTGVSVLGCVLPEGAEPQGERRARDCG